MSEYENELDEYDKKFKRKVEKSLFDPSYDKSVDDFNAEYGTRVRMLIGGVPVLGDFERSYDNYRYYDDYLRNRGMSWSDVKYPTRLNAGLSSAYGTLNFVSKNVMRLYR